MVSATLSIGYDVHHLQVEDLLAEAAAAAGLRDPFVHVVELGDFSVTYRVAGFLDEVRGLLTARSNLRRAALDRLHDAGVEIMSPTFMNQRALSVDDTVLPSSPTTGRPLPRAQEDDRIFDKAVKAGRLEQLRDARADLESEIRELEAAKREASGEDRERVDRELRRRQAHLNAMSRALEVRSGELDDDG